MLQTENKNGIYSIIVGLFGWIYLIWLTRMIEIDQARIFNEYGHLLVQFPESTEYASFKYLLIAIGIGIIGIFFGIKSNGNKNKIGLVGIILSILVIVMTFVTNYVGIIYI